MMIIAILLAIVFDGSAEPRRAWALRGATCLHALSYVPALIG